MLLLNLSNSKMGDVYVFLQYFHVNEKTVDNLSHLVLISLTKITEKIIKCFFMTSTIEDKMRNAH